MVDVSHLYAIKELWIIDSINVFMKRNDDVPIVSFYMYGKTEQRSHCVFQAEL